MRSREAGGLGLHLPVRRFRFFEQGHIDTPGPVGLEKSEGAHLHRLRTLARHQADPHPRGGFSQQIIRSREWRLGLSSSATASAERATPAAGYPLAEVLGIFASATSSSILASKPTSSLSRTASTIVLGIVFPSVMTKAFRKHKLSALDCRPSGRTQNARSCTRISPITRSADAATRCFPNRSPRSPAPISAAKSTLDSRKEDTRAIGVRDMAQSAIP